MRPDLPRGTVTFLFTDIEGSTRLLRRLGPELTTEGPEQAKELLRQLIKEIRVHNRRRIIPIYRVPAAVRTTPSKVGGDGLEPPTPWV